MSTLVIASRNHGKLTEFAQLLAKQSISVRPISEFSDDDVEETGLSFVENALLKARHACQVSGLPAIADDSGLVVPVLQGQPGIYSARYAGSPSDSQANNQKLLQALEEVDIEQRGAYFVCCLVYLAYATDPCPIICQANWHGCIVTEEQGEHGFGYDPLFYVEQYQCTSAQLVPEIKNQISHRGQAMRKLTKQLHTLF